MSDKIGPPAQHILETDVKGDISLYDPRIENVTVLNGTASDIWLLCDGSHTVEEIVSLLASSYDVAEESIADEVKKTIAQFEEAGLFAE